MLGNLKSFYKTVIEKILDVEKHFRGKTGKEKRDAVVEYMVGLVDIPGIPNFIENPIKRFVFGFIVDKAVEKLNLFTDWDFAGITLSPGQAEKLAEIVDTPVPLVAQAMTALPPTASIDEKLDALYKAYAVAIVPSDNTAEETPVPCLWEMSIAFVLAREGGYVNHPADKGGETNMGITKGTLMAAYAQGLVPHREPKKLTKDEAEAIYRANYWDRYGWGNIAWPVCLVLFDATVNHGGGGMAKLAQRSANMFDARLDDDGKFGPKTLAALTSLSETQPIAFSEEFLRQRKKYFDNIIAQNPSQEVFKNGWYNRLKHLADTAGVMSPL